MSTPSTIIQQPDTIASTEPGNRWMHALRQRDRLWLALIILIIAAFSLGGCHARSGGHVHASSCGSSSGDAALAVFYVVYLLGWIIVSSAGG